MIFTTILLSLCISAIIVCCFVFADKYKTDNTYISSIPPNPAVGEDILDDPNDQKDDTNKAIELTMFLGDNYDFSKHVTSSPSSFYTYKSSDEETASFNSGSTLVAKKCGEVSIEIFDHNTSIKSFDVTIEYKFELVPVSDCIVENSHINITGKSPKFVIKLISSDDKEVLTNSPTIITTNGISISRKFGNLFISATQNGQAIISYNDVNVILVLSITLSS